MDCPGIPQISFGEFNKKLIRDSAAQRVPIDGTIELTMRCNLHCVHCYCVYDKEKKELTTKEWKNVIDQIVDAGCLFLLLTGGEPLLRTDFIDIYLYAVRKGLIVSIYTNGVLFNDQIIESLVRNPPFTIEISLYGASEETYHEVTGSKDVFNKLVSNIKKIIDNKLPLKLKTVLLTINKDELDKIRSLCNSLGISSFRFDPIINPRLDGSLKPLNYRLDADQIVDYESNDMDRWNEMKAFMSDYAGKNDDNNNYLYNCAAGVRMFHIDSFGNVGICINARHDATNVLKKSFTKIWQKDVNDTIYRTSQKLECLGCAYLDICDRCPGWAVLETGELDKKIDFACQVTMKRYKMYLAEKGGFNEEKTI